MDDIDPTKDYRKLLADLTHRGNNSKRLIYQLTMLAEDNETHAAKIVEVIETHLQQVDEETRKYMFEVRKTWYQHFTGRKMYALDVQVNIIDNEWPLPTSTSNISSIKHVNPTFLPQQRDESLPLPDLPPIEDDEAEMRRQLIAKQAELLKLQQKRLELELKETETRLAQQKKISADLFDGVEPETASQPGGAATALNTQLMASQTVPRDPGYNEGGRGGPQPSDPDVPSKLHLENGENILRTMEMRRKSGEISHNDIQTVLRSLSEFDLIQEQRRHQPLRQDPPHLEPEISSQRDDRYRINRSPNEPIMDYQSRRNDPSETPMEFQSPIKEPRNLPHDADMRRDDCPPVFDDLRREDGPPRGTPLDRNRDFDQRDRTRAAERPQEDMHTYRESDRPSHRGTDRPKDDRLSLRGQDRPPHVRGRDFDKPRRPSLLENNALFVGEMLESLRSEHTPENSQDVPDKISKVDVKPKKEETPITKNPPKPAVEGLPTPPDVKILDPVENQKLKDSDIDIKSSDRDRKGRSKRGHSGRSSPSLGQSGSQQTPVSIVDLNVPKPPGLKKDMNNDRRRGSPLNEERPIRPVRHRDRRRRSPHRERRNPNRRGRRSPILKDDRGRGSPINDQSNFNGPRNMPPFGPGQQGPNPHFNPVGPNQPFPQRPNQPFPPNQQFSGPNQPPFQQGPNQRFSSGPNQMSFPVGPNQPFQPGPNQKFPPGPNQQFPQGPNQPMQQFPPGPRPPMQQDEGSQGPNQQFPSDPNVHGHPMQLIPPMQNMPVPSQPMPIMSRPPMPVLNQPIPAMSQSMPIPGQCMPGQTIPFIPSVSMMPVYSPELTEAQSRYDKTGLADLEEKLISSFANSDIWREGKQCIGVIQRMYSGKQCTSCSTRFMASQTKLYREHLDWHFRQNQRGKKGAKISRYRSWFYELKDWLDYEDVGDAEERGPNQQFPSGPNVQGHPMQLIPPMQNMPVPSQSMPIMSRPPMPVLNQPIPAMSQSMPIPEQSMPGQTIPFIPSVSMMPALQSQLNVESLLQKLIKAGLINANTDEAKETSENKEPVKDLQKKKEEDNSGEGKEKWTPVDGLDYEVGGDAQERVYSPELTEALSRYDETGLADMEEKLISSFSNGGNCGEFKEKTFFNYLLLDPRVTKDLPMRMNSLGDVESFKVFVGAIFYVGKGKRSRPFDHLKEAIRQMEKPGSDKVKRILDIWNKKKGVISLHCFQNVISDAAHTREACMIDAISLNPLTNQIRGSCCGISKTWSEKQRKNMGVYFLKRALQIFKGEGENQLFYDNILKVGQ